MRILRIPTNLEQKMCKIHLANSVEKPCDVGGFLSAVARICDTGYLQKKAKTGKWQKRWFETNAHYLTYYKVRMPKVRSSRSSTSVLSQLVDRVSPHYAIRDDVPSQPVSYFLWKIISP